ncbi:MAG: hypothetical protein KAU31_01510 [Spirochaetaceae bacterium]|nr:hypothetical protein [Spirochaetaceae bacterium]
MVNIPKDFREFLQLLNDHAVEYVIVGGYALAFHGAPRFTGDMDVLVRPTEENARSLIAALNDFGFSDLSLTEQDFMAVDRVVQLGVPPMRIDLLTSIDGVDFEAAAAGSIRAEIAEITIPFIGREALVKNKRASGRPKDLADLEALGE